MRRTPLHYAVLYDQAALAKHLIRCGGGVCCAAPGALLRQAWVCTHQTMCPAVQARRGVHARPPRPDRSASRGRARVQPRRGAGGAAQSTRSSRVNFSQNPCGMSVNQGAREILLRHVPPCRAACLDRRQPRGVVGSIARRKPRFRARVHLANSQPITPRGWAAMAGSRSRCVLCVALALVACAHSGGFASDRPIRACPGRPGAAPTSHLRGLPASSTARHIWPPACAALACSPRARQQVPLYVPGRGEPRYGATRVPARHLAAPPARWGCHIHVPHCRPTRASCLVWRR